MAQLQAKSNEQDDLSVFDMALPVTRHALIPESEDFEYLASGVDSLDLGIYIDWNPNKFSKVLDLLDYCKRRAKEKNDCRGSW